MDGNHMTYKRMKDNGRFMFWCLIIESNPFQGVVIGHRFPNFASNRSAWRCLLSHDSSWFQHFCQTSQTSLLVEFQPCGSANNFMVFDGQFFIIVGLVNLFKLWPFWAGPNFSMRSWRSQVTHHQGFCCKPPLWWNCCWNEWFLYVTKGDCLPPRCLNAHALCLFYQVFPIFLLVTYSFPLIVAEVAEVQLLIFHYRLIKGPQLPSFNELI